LTEFSPPHIGSLSRLGRRGIGLGETVDLPVWQRPAAMAISLGFFTVALGGELYSSVSRSFKPLPTTNTGRKTPAIA
jgi:hypothetical protein